jgi:CRP-like cAMP-binding protein
MSSVRTSTASQLAEVEPRMRPCVGCTAVSRGMLCALVNGGEHSCAFDSLSIEAREVVPATWWARYAFAMVRRGYLIRERVDARGRRTAVDVVGPGCTFSIDRDAAAGPPARISAYAVTRALICWSGQEAIDAALDQGGADARQLHVLDREAMARMERLAEARGRSTAPSKVGALLCALADTLRPAHEDARIPSEFLQRDLASLLTIRHESVCRVLRDFEKRGFISRDADGTTIIDRAGLERA